MSPCAEGITKAADLIAPPRHVTMAWPGRNISGTRRPLAPRMMTNTEAECRRAMMREGQYCAGFDDAAINFTA